MPRKTSQAVKKDTAPETKIEGPSPRRSGRAVTKVESTSGKEASRSRRSSTAAQTAASVADSKTPKSRSSSRRESTSPSDGRTRSHRESTESTGRARSARRNAGPVSYKESDGEEEAPTPKFDENFDSGDEFEESESDEKAKPKEKARPARAAAKSRTSKEKSKTPRSRKGKSTGKKSTEDEVDSEEDVKDEAEEEEAESATSNKKVEVESAKEEVKITPAKRSRTTPAKDKTPKEPPKSSTRGRRGKSEVVAETKPAEEKPKPSRRSARSTSNKEEPTKKRPSRGMQAKKYTEEEEEEIEEIEEVKEEEKVEAEPEAEGSRKRKRNSASEPNKRLKEDVSEEETKITKVEEEEKVEAVEDIAKDVQDSKAEVKDEEKEKDDSGDEPMEIDESEPVAEPEEEEKPPAIVDEPKEDKTEPDIINEENIDDKEDKENISDSKEKLSVSKKQESIDSSENMDESMHSSDSEQGSRAEQSVSSGLEDSQDAKVSKKDEPKELKATVQEPVKQQEIDLTSQSSESFEIIDENSEEAKIPPVAPTEEKPEKLSEVVGDEKIEENDSPKKEDVEIVSNDNDIPTQESKSSTPEVAVTVGDETSPASPVMHSKQPSNSEPSMNGPEKSSPISNTTPIVHTNLENLAPRANGAHDDLHNSSPSPKSQYYSLPGRKYVLNSKLNENVRQSTKDKTFGFVSYNLTPSSSEVYLQKEKLLNELNTLDAHIICIQQVSKAFYVGALEPSLDALGFKGIFSQPEDSLKGLATFYKTSLFKVNGQCETSLKHLIEKELESSSLDPSDRAAVKAHVKRCGSVLLTNFSTVSEEDAITIANVQVPPTDLSIQTLQVSCLGREVFRINGGVNRPLLIGGELNMKESEAPYQLLRDGYLSNDMIEELMRRKDVVLPGKENAALVNLLWKSYQHPSSNLSSCYKTVLEHEVFIPEKKITSPDLLWYSSDCLHTIGVLDLVSDKQSDHHFSLKADIAFFP